MDWRGWISIVVVLLVGFVALTYINRQRWVSRDVERQIRIAELRAESDRHSVIAAEERQRKDAAMASAAMHAAARAEAEAELEEMRKRWRNRPVSNDIAVLRGQIKLADALITKLDADITLANKTILALNEALVASNAETDALSSQVAVNEQAWQLERERTETWQQQTKRGRVKTAFLTIGAATAGGLAGYGIGATVQ
jgi:hypothetical protein